MTGFRRTAALIAALAALPLGACTENDTPTDLDGSDFEGFWTLTVDVTEANGVCAGEELEPPSVRETLITQEGSTITATAMWTTESGSVSLTGTRSDDQITFGGSYAEDGGTTTALYTLQIGEGTLDGVEAWSWTGPGGSCPDGRATVTGVPR